MSKPWRSKPLSSRAPQSRPQWSGRICFRNYVKVHWRGMFSVAYPLLLLLLFLLSTEPPMRCFYVLLVVSGFWTFEVLPMPVTAMIPLFIFPAMNLMDTESVAACYANNTMIFIGGLMLVIAIEYSNLHTRISLHVIKKIGFSPRKLLVGLVIITACSAVWISTTAATAMMIKIVYSILKEMEADGMCQMWIRSTDPAVLEDSSWSSDSIASLAQAMRDEAQAVRQMTPSDERLEREFLNDAGRLPTFDDAVSKHDIVSAYYPDRRSRFLSHLGSLNVLDQTQHPEATHRPTKITMCYFLSTSFAANIGGLPTLVGSGPNKVLKGMIYGIFPKAEGITYLKWLGINFPIMLMMLLLTTLWMQFFYLGLFRPHSKDARAISMNVAGVARAKDMIEKKIDDLPPMSFQEITVAILSFVVAGLCISRDPSFMPGWEVFNKQIHDDTISVGTFILMFIIPAKPHCFRACSKDETKRPRGVSHGLLTWTVVLKKFPWGLIFLLGGGVALAVGLRKSGASHLIAEKLDHVIGYKQYGAMVILCLIAAVLTQVMCSAVVPNIFLPIVAELAVEQKVHPLYYMLPVTMICNFAFCMPASAPSTAMACFACNIRTTELLKISIPVTIICVLVVFTLFPVLGPLVWETDIYPAWADSIDFPSRNR